MVQQTQEAPPIAVAGVGASAGGLSALEEMLRGMPADTGVAFVIVQHLSPDYDSVLDELLDRCTQLPVRRVDDGVVVAANQVYVIPPRKEMIISGGRLLLTDKEPSPDLALPIDVFLRSLARDAGERAVGVVLSGTGTDGSRGIREIHDAGGLVLCQSEDSAKFDGMPRAAAATGIVDLVLAPDEMPAAIAKYAERLSGAGGGAVAGPPPNERAALDQVLGLLRSEFGIDFSAYKPHTVTRRIERRLLLQNASDLEEYAHDLTTDELNRLYHDLLIGVTRFFRDRETFDLLRGEVLPQLVRRLPEGEELRAWCAGCATGEEAYSLAIALREVFAEADRPVNVKIFATDVHRRSIDVASEGVYPAASLDGISPEYRERYFVEAGEAYRVSTELRQMIVFAPHNLVNDAPFTRLDLISCRNLLIYLRSAVQKRVLSLFHFGLKRDGILVLGGSENASAFADEFDEVMPRSRIFRKRRDTRLPPEPRAAFRARMPQPVATAPLEGKLSVSELLRTYDDLLADYMPPALLIDRNRHLLHSFGGASELLRLREGRPSMDTLEIIREELRMPLTGALQRARRSGEAVSFGGISLEDDDGRYRLTAKPMGSDAQMAPVLVTIERMEPGSAAAQPPPAPDIDVGELSRDQVRELERELQHTRESLQATIEELETSNEELQATNEELVASNEELQSTNEELQSVNEELYTVNAELQKKIQELTELTNDMDNLLSSTEVGTIFLDGDLRVRKFTPRVAQTFSLLPQDIGRPIASFTHNIQHDGLIDDLREVLATARQIERDVQDREDRWYFLRLLPYRWHGAVDGVVLTLIDIATLKRAEERIRRAVTRRDEFLAMLSHELRNPLAAILNSAQLARLRGLEATACERAIQVVERQSTHMARLLDDLLDVSRITQNKIELKRAPLDVRSVVEPAIEEVRARLEERDIQLDIDLPAHALPVHGDRARLQQVLANLLDNAAKYATAGGQARLIMRSDAGGVTIRVIDDGIGIDEAALEEVFEPFVQGDQDLSRSGAGMGVGLALVRSIVGMHDGTTSAHSDGPGKGAELRVWLPSTDTQIEGDAPGGLDEHAPSPAPSTTADVLVVEDDDDNRDTLRELLQTWGYRVSVAARGREAVDKILSLEPRVALVDIGLPDIDGYEVAARVRERDGVNVRLVALTGYGRDDDREAARRAGFDDHLVKPVDVRELERLLADDD